MKKMSLSLELLEFYQGVAAFFGLKQVPVPRILLAESRSEFNSLYGSKTHAKMAAFTYKRKDVVTFAKEIFERRTKYKLPQWDTFVKHQLVHILFYLKFKTNKPVWLLEGLSQYLSGQSKPDIKVSSDDIVRLSEREGFIKDRDAYAKSLKLVKMIFCKR